MNERIKQILTSPALVRLRDWSDIGPVQCAELEEFADLLIQECIITVKKRYMGDNNREDMEVLRCVSELKNRFGVE